MNFLDEWFLNFIDYVSKMEAHDFLFYFWFFIFIEFSRYIVFDVLIGLKKLSKKDKEKIENNIAREKLYKENPLVSVIVPGKNEGKHIRKLSNSLKTQTYKHIEIIIVDDGSDDNTKELCTKLLKEGMIDKFIRNEERGGKGSAANTALRFSKGKYIVHLDADSYLRDDSVETILVPFYKDENIGAVGGDIRVNNVEESLSTICQSVEYFKTISFGRLVTSELNILRIISGAYGAFRKDILDQIGGWDVGPGLDGDITLKIRKIGYKVVFEEKSICYTNTPNTFMKLGRQRFRWNRSLVRFRLRKHIDFLDFENKNFNIHNYLTLLDGLLYDFVFNYFWWTYIIFIVISHHDGISYFLFLNYLLYLCSNLIQFSIISFFFKDTFRKVDWKLFYYLPLIPLYTGIFLRLVRTYAQLMEIFFKVSYNDNWNPWKVSKIAKDKGF